MNSHKPVQKLRKLGFVLLSLVSAASISGSYLLAGGPVFLPLVIQSQPSPTLSPTPTQTGTADPSATPRPPETQQLVVTPASPDKPWALAFFAKSYNAGGRPVMQIYPGDSSDEADRIKIPRGEAVLALKDPVTADGGGKFWQLVDLKGRKGEVLFLRAADVTKIVATQLSHTEDPPG